MRATASDSGGMPTLLLAPMLESDWNRWLTARTMEFVSPRRKSCRHFVRIWDYALGNTQRMLIALLKYQPDIPPSPRDALLFSWHLASGLARPIASECDQWLASCQFVPHRPAERMPVSPRIAVRFHHLPVRPPPRFIAELIALAASDGRGLADLAQEISVDVTTLMQYRSGRRTLSMRAYANILKRFGDQRVVRDLALHYAAVEYHPRDESRAIATPPEALMPSTVRALIAYVERFAEETLRGGAGLYLVGADANASAASTFVGQLFVAAKVPYCVLRAHEKPRASQARDALAMPLLIVERIDFACEPVADLLRRRADLRRPTIVTSRKPPDAIADPYLRRVLVALTRVIGVDPPTEKASAPVPAHANA